MSRSPSDGGRGRSRTRCTSSATGAGKSTTWPVTVVEPSLIALRIRTSAGSIPNAAASLSICDSYAYVGCTAPSPRMAPQGGLLVYTPQPSIFALGTLYGPTLNVVPLPTTTGVLEAYAPPSKYIRARTYTRSPAEVAPCS